MRQAEILLATFQKHLKQRGITYRDLAKKTDQSESNIKRIFSSRSISLEGLERLCEAAEIELLELARLSRPEKEAALSFSKAQEETLARDPKLFAFFYIVLAHPQLARIADRYDYSINDGRKYCLKLDKLGLIEFLPGDKIRPRVSPNIRWIPDGPLNAAYREDIKKEFLEGYFAGPHERIRLLGGKLSAASLTSLSRRMDRLIAEFVEAAEIDESAPAGETKHVWLMLAYRPWTFSVVKRVRRGKVSLFK